MVAEEHYPLPERTQETLEHALLNTIAVFIDSCQRKIRELIAISVILPWLVDPESGVIRYMPHIQVENWGLVEALEKRFHVTCFVGHDIRSWRWRNTTSAPVRIARTRFWCAFIVVQAPGLSPTDASSLAVTATSAKLGIFRWSRWASAATAVISAV